MLRWQDCFRKTSHSWATQMPTIGISYTPSAGSPVYSFQIDNFGDNAMPRSYVGSFAFSQSLNGANILGGPAFRQKYQWVISTIMNTSDAQSFDAMFQSWDVDRASGLTAACGIIDETWGAVVDTSAVFITAPTYTRLSPILTLVSFGLQEV